MENIKLCKQADKHSVDGIATGIFRAEVQTVLRITKGHFLFITSHAFGRRRNNTNK